MFYSFVTLSLVLVTSIIFLPKFRKTIEQQGHAVSFFLTLVATLVGVLLAIAISNYEETQKEKDDVSKLIRASIHSVETCFEYSEALLEQLDKSDRKSEAHSNFLDDNPLPYPDYLDVFVAQNIISKNLSDASLSDLNELLINLKRSLRLNEDLYLTLLSRTRQLLEAELLFQQGQINEKQLEQKLDAIEALPLTN